MTRVKICGITRLEDAQLAGSLGAWAVGFVFWSSSPRAVSAATARAIVRELPPWVTAVGVFVNERADRMRAVAAEVGLGVVQLHGDETPRIVEDLPGRVIKAVTLDGAGSLDEWPARVVPLIDAHDTARRGGTGQTVDWARAAAIARVRPVVLAGGITPANVAEALRTVAPAAIDVSSGVESSPGIKDAVRMRALFDAIGRAEVES
jgi:phosphoribosylanthranilate isomerase